MPNFLVISHTHSLLPFAHRLQRQGHTVKTVVVVRQFENAWHGKLSPSPRAENRRDLDEAFLTALLADAKEGDWIVITDNREIEARLRDEGGIAPERIYGTCQFDEPVPTSVVRIGGWFDGEVLRSIFGVVADRGAQQGGMGADVDGALTLVRVDNTDAQAELRELVDSRVQELKSRGFRGLVQFGLEFQTDNGAPQVSGIDAGWPFLVTHGFLSENDDIGGLLGGDTAPRLLPKKFVTVLPVSRPPWPTEKAKFRFSTEPIDGLTPKQQGRVFWHDVQVDQEAGQLKTAGLDGLVCVARGAADTSSLSLARALEIASSLIMPEKQFRLDAGQQVQNLLAQLEHSYELLL